MSDLNQIHTLGYMIKTCGVWQIVIYGKVYTMPQYLQFLKDSLDLGMDTEIEN